MFTFRTKKVPADRELYQIILYSNYRKERYKIKSPFSIDASSCRCGTHEECFRDWWRGSSDNDKCTGYDDTQTVNNAIHCVFCCDKNLCNEPTVPLKDDLYKPT